MQLTVTALHRISYAVHTICLIAVIALTMKYPGTMPVLLVVGTLIGLASITTVEHRYIPLFVAFGLMLAPTFWIAVGSVNMRMYLGLIPAVLLVVGIAWTLQQPGWIPVGFSAAAVAMLLLILRFGYIHRFENDYATPEQVIQSATINSVFILMSLLEAVMGVCIATVAPPRSKRKKKRSSKIAIPSEN